MLDDNIVHPKRIVIFSLLERKGHVKRGTNKGVRFLKIFLKYSHDKFDRVKGYTKHKSSFSMDGIAQTSRLVKS